MIVRIPVAAAGPGKQALLGDEDLVADLEMGRALVRCGHGAADQGGPARSFRRRASGC
jgi:hypothetical protein